jgi:hypothetical protein
MGLIEELASKCVGATRGPCVETVSFVSPKGMPARATTKRKISNVSNLSRKELALVDAIVTEIDVNKLQNLNSQS